MIFTIVENKQKRLGHLLELNESLKKYDYPVKIMIKNDIKKTLELPQNELKKPKEKQTDKVLPIISNMLKISH